MKPGHAALLIGRGGVCSLIVVLLVSCGKTPLSYEETGGILEIRAQIVKVLGKAADLKQTICDSLVIQVSAPDMDTIRRSRKIDQTVPVFVDTIASIPSGRGRSVKVWTVNRNGDVIHTDSLGIRTVTIDPNRASPLAVKLLPAVGSLYIQLGGIPTRVDSVYATFTASELVWFTHVKRATKVYLSIDRIPHQTRGVLGVAGVDTAGDTLYYAETNLVFNALRTSTVNLEFGTVPGFLAVTATMSLPGATVASGSMAGVEVAGSESGDLIITEIMYAANDSEYVEIHNRGATEQVFDSLILEIDGTYRYFTNITVGAGGYYVFGRQGLPWVDQVHSVQSALDLSSNGNWITLRTKDSLILDQVIFAGGSNGLEWPNVNTKKSIVLHPDAYDAGMNNYGRNWSAATTLISGSTSQYGTPRSR